MLINVTDSYAATYYWVGSPGGNTNSASNWVTTNPTSCTGGGAGVPGATDDIIFDPDCDNNATINTNLVANTYTIQAGYTGTITQNSGITISTPSTGSGVDWTQADGTFVGGNSDISFYRDFLITGGTFTSTSGTLYFARNLTVSGGTFNHNGGTLSFALLGATSCGSGRSINAPNVVFNLFIINRPFTANVSCNLSIAAGTTIPLGNSPTITLTSSGGGGTTGLVNNGTITVGTGTFAATIDGTFTNNGTIISKTTTKTNSAGGAYSNGAGSTVQFIGDGNGASNSFTLSSFATAYHHLTVATTDTGDTVDASASPTITVGGDFTLSSGSFLAPTTKTVTGNFLQTGGTYSAGTILNVAGNFTHSGGTFTENTGTVVLNGTNQTISGSTQFNNLTKSVVATRTLTFESGSTQTVSGTLTLNGASGQLLYLRSSLAGSRWNLAPSGTRTVSFLDVQDGNNTSLVLISPTNSVDSGNNIYWFTLPTSTPTPSPTPTPTPTTTPTNTLTPTITPTTTPTTTPTGTYTVTSTETPTTPATETPTDTTTATPTALSTETPTVTPTETPTTPATETPTPTTTATPTALSTETPTVTSTETPTTPATETPTDTTTATPTAISTDTPTVTATEAPTNTPTATPTALPSQTPTVMPTSSPTTTPTSPLTVITFRLTIMETPIVGAPITIDSQIERTDNDGRVAANLSVSEQHSISSGL